jgi:hypothetical protein
MTRSSSLGQCPFYGILAIVILFLSQTRLQANGVGEREFTTAHKTFTRQMATFKQHTPVIHANEDSDEGMLKIVRENLDGICQILKAFEPIRGVVDAPEIDTDDYINKIHRLAVLFGGSTQPKKSTSNRVAANIQTTVAQNTETNF